MTCETCVFSDTCADGTFCEYHAEPVSSTVENCPHYTPVENNE